MTAEDYLLYVVIGDPYELTTCYLETKKRDAFIKAQVEKHGCDAATAKAVWHLLDAAYDLFPVYYQSKNP